MRRTLVVGMIVVGMSGVARADDPPLYECHAPPADSKISVQFKTDTSIRDVVTWALGFTCRNIVLTSEAERAAPHVTINGYALDSADKALEVYTKLKTANHLSVGLERNGQKVTMDYTIR